MMLLSSFSHYIRMDLVVVLSDGNNHLLGDRPIIKRCLNGIFNNRPALLRHVSILDTSCVLNHLKNRSKLEFGHKIINIIVSYVNSSVIRPESTVVTICKYKSHVKRSSSISHNKIVKNSRPRFHVKPLVLNRYTIDADLCVLTTLTVYLERNAPLRGECTALFISVQKPYKQVTVNTISRWIKTL